MEIELNPAEYRAVSALRGLPSGAHMLIMTSRSTDAGGMLSGSADAFEELVEFIGGELADGMVSRAAAGPLRSACIKIDPTCRDWLGM